MSGRIGRTDDLENAARASRSYYGVWGAPGSSGGKVRMPLMVIHTFAFRWKPGVTQDQKQRAITEIRNLQGRIPGLLETLGWRKHLTPLAGIRARRRDEIREPRRP